MLRRFPRTREDGSFCVVVKFETIQDAAALRDQITEWCSQWVAENNLKTRKQVILDEDGNESQPYDYFRAYAGPPYVIKAECNQLWLRFDGMPGSYWWRDWLAHMMVGLTHAFPELQHKDRISDACDA